MLYALPSVAILKTTPALVEVEPLLLNIPYKNPS
jgi:hypothetical protein